MYQANVYTVMVASPGDVIAERQAAREVILDWNDMHSRDTGIVLMPHLWENNTWSEMGDRPQAIINKQMVAKADLLVAIFWTRLGSSTGVALSGTVEEINEHSGKDRPTMLFFSQVPIDPTTTDRKQQAKLEKYQKSVRKSALYFSFKSIEEFKSIFSKQLAMTIHGNPVFVKRGGSAPAADSTQPVKLTPEMVILLAYASQSPADGFAVRDNAGHMDITGSAGRIARIAQNGKPGPWKAAIEELLELLLLGSKDGSWESLFLTERGSKLTDSGQIRLLGARAKKLLRAAIAEKGRIFLIDRQGGLYIKVGNDHMIEDRDNETVAAYKAALRELEEMQLIERDDSSYMVTEKGYKYGRDYHIISVVGAGEI